MRKFIIFLLIGAFTLSPTKSEEEEPISIWELGTIPYQGGCVKNGISLIPIPGLEDPWPLNLHCNTHSGSVGCFKDNQTAAYGLCRCNQRGDAHPDNVFNPTLCLGKVGAYCTAEHHSFFPDKLCTPNAYCKPLQSGPGRTVGKCECLHGYNEEDGKCLMDVNLPDLNRSTTVQTTTTTAPPKEAIKLPSLNLLIGINFVTLDSQCNSNALLNRTFCSTYGGTVSCLKGTELGAQSKCQCNMQSDSIFDEELHMCVGMEGAHCLARGYLLGHRACVKNADCMVEEGTSYEDGYSFGTCECLYGYDRDGKGNCVRNEDISRPSTRRPIVIRTSTTNPGSTEDGGGSNTTPDDNNSSSNIKASGILFLFMMFCFCLLNFIL